LGRLLLVLPPFLVGYILVRPRVKAGVTVTPSPVTAVLGGAAAGLAAGVLTGICILIANALPEQLSPRNVFVAVTPSLLSIMTFGRPIGIGVALLAVISTVAGGFGGGLGVVAWRGGGPVVVGVGGALALGGVAEGV